MSQDNAKKAAGIAAASLVTDGMALGLGTGSTVAHFLDALAARGLDISGVPTSIQTAEHCNRIGIRLLDPADAPELDLCVDGADELDEQLNLTKGGGGALLREKVVASLARKMVVIATPDKVVERLGITFPIPIEVVPFSVGPVTKTLESWGCEITARGNGDYRTDNGNSILDARIIEGIDDPSAFEAQCLLVPGVAECGIFTDLATLALLGHEDGTVTRLELG